MTAAQADSVTVYLQLDGGAAAVLAAHPDASINYTYRIWTYDVEEVSIGPKS